MRRRKDILDEVKYKYIHSNDKSCEMFLRILCDYYTKNDLETGDHLGDTSDALYLSSDNLSIDEIVEKYYIGISTLKRYRKRFNDLAAKLLPL